MRCMTLYIIDRDRYGIAYNRTMLYNSVLFEAVNIRSRSMMKQVVYKPMLFIFASNDVIHR
jgi:hypothetical protein